MCLAYPMKVIEIRGQVCIAAASGLQRKVNIQMIEGLEVGDYILVHAGFAIEKLKEEDARENLRIIDELNAKLSDLSG